MDKLNQLFSNSKLPLILVAVGLVLTVGGFFSSNLLPSKSNQYPKESLYKKEAQITSPKQIKIDISGAINSPGVYSLDQNSRVEDAIKVSGGFLNSANKIFISKTLNLSQKLTDGTKLYIPFEGEQASAPIVAGVATSSKVSINNATQKELEDLPSIGPTTALKIIASRPYNSIEELISKKALTKTVFSKIKDLISE